MEKLLELEPNQITTENDNQIISAKVILVGDSDIVFDLGQKEEGYCAKSEFSEKPNVGEVYKIIVINREKDGTIRISRKAAEKHFAWQEFLQAYQEKKNITVTVEKLEVNGYLVVYQGLIQLFLPGSHARSRHRQPIKEKESIEVCILKVRSSGFTAIVSHRVVIENEIEKAWVTLSDKYKVGSIVSATIVKKVAFGFFLNLDGVDGLLHKRDISYLKQPVLREKFEIGKQVEAMILNMEQEKQRLSFGIKQLSEDPWIWVKNTLKVGEKIKGVVHSFASYGAFVIIENRIEALVYRTEFSWVARPRSPSEYIEKGEEREFIIKSIDFDAKRICLSIKDLEKDQWEEKVNLFPVGTVVRGKVVGIAKMGIYVELTEGLDAFISFIDFAWENPDPKMLKRNEEVEFKIRKIDFERKKILGSIRELQDSPAENFFKNSEKNKTLKTTISGKNDAGVVVQIDDTHLRGFLSAREFKFIKDKSTLEVGEKLELNLVGVDKRRIGLVFSLRKQKTAAPIKFKRSHDSGHHRTSRILQQELQSTYTPFEILSSESHSHEKKKKKKKKFEKIETKNIEQEKKIIPSIKTTSVKEKSSPSPSEASSALSSLSKISAESKQEKVATPSKAASVKEKASPSPSEASSASSSLSKISAESKQEKVATPSKAASVKEKASPSPSEASSASSSLSKISAESKQEKVATPSKAISVKEKSSPSPSEASSSSLSSSKISEQSKQEKVATPSKATSVKEKSSPSPSEASSSSLSSSKISEQSKQEKVATPSKATSVKEKSSPSPSEASSSSLSSSKISEQSKQEKVATPSKATSVKEKSSPSPSEASSASSSLSKISVESKQEKVATPSKAISVKEKSSPSPSEASSSSLSSSKISVESKQEKMATPSKANNEKDE